MTDLTYLATYVWLDANSHLRCKYRVLEAASSLTERAVFPVWVVQGQELGFAEPEICLVPVRVVRDPFSDKASDVVMLCECVHPVTSAPLLSNTRAAAMKILTNGRNMHPTFTITQQYVLSEAKSQPYQWSTVFSEKQVPKQSLTYCGIGAGHAIGRDIALRHCRACQVAGLKVTSLNAAKMPAQWEFQIGVLEGIHAADELWLARFFLEIICEREHLRAVFHPKPKRKFAGSACYVTYSNDRTREPLEGVTQIMLIIHSLQQRHKTDIGKMGAGNDLRLHDGYEECTYGIGDLHASICIPARVFVQKSGHLEDRRPGANCDPYVVMALIHETAVEI